MNTSERAPENVAVLIAGLEKANDMQLIQLRRLEGENKTLRSQVTRLKQSRPQLEMES